MKRLSYFLISFFVFFSVAYAAPSVIYQRNVLPETNNRYDLGTSSPLQTWKHVYSQNASTTALTISGISGSTQCLTIDATGVVSGTGGACATSISVPVSLANGGTGSTTAPSSWLIYGGGNSVYQSVATSSASCGTYITCSSFTVVGSVSPSIALNSTLSSNQVIYTNSAGTGLLSVSTSSPSFGISFASTTSISSTGGAVFASSGGSVGVGTTSPTNTLSISGGYFDVNGNGAGGYKFDGNKFIYASSTNFATVVGIGAGTGLDATSTWVGDTAIGYQALAGTPINSATVGQNTAVGYQALTARTGGFKNTAVGYQALQSVTTGNFATAMGWLACNKLLTGNFNDCFGEESLRNATGGGNDGFGAGAFQNITSGTNNTGVGVGAAFNAGTSASRNLVLGEHAMFGSTGAYADNIAIGFTALGTSTAIGNNNFIGGSSAALNGLTTAFTGNVMIGYQAGKGAGAGYGSTGGVYLGYQAGLAVASSSDYNTLIGYQAGSNITSGNDNIIIGPSVNTGGSNLTSGMNNILIGTYNVLPPIGATNNNQLNLGNILFGTLPATSTATSLVLPTTGAIGVGTSSPFAKFSIQSNNGDTNINLFAIGSTTALATTTHFRVLNDGTIFAPNTGSSGANQTGYWCYDANGQLIRDTTTCLVSAAKFKKNIRPLDIGLTELLKVKPVAFYYKDSAFGKGEQMGVIADQVAQIDTRLIAYDNVGAVHGFNYEEYTAWLTRAIQDFYHQFEKLTARVSGLEQKINYQQQEIDALQAQINELKHGN